VPDAAAIRRVALISAAFLLVRIGTMTIVAQPGYTDAYYYADVATRLARGAGLSADFVWNPIELGTLPVVSHRFWMPLATVLQGGGIASLGPLLGDFRAAQTAIVIASALVTPAAYFCARLLAAGERAAMVAAAIVGLGGLFAPAWVTLDGFAPAALIGALFFIAFAIAAKGSVRAGATAGALVGLLYLTRAEGALFGLALVALAMRSPSRSAGLAGSAVALAIGAAWLGRGIALGGSPDLLARTVLLARYEDFFAIDPTGSVDLGTMLATRFGALWSDLVVALFGLMAFLAFPLALGVRSTWRQPAVRAFAGLALLIYVAEGVIWPLHATRGSYFHSLAAFYPFAMALVALGGETWLARRDQRGRLVATSATIAAAAALAVFGLSTWDTTFNGGYRARVEAVDAIPSGPFLAIDGAAWRWIADRPVLVTPADGPNAAACVATRYGATSVVLEAAHFSAYDGLYRGELAPWLGPPIDRGTIRIYPVRGSVLCSVRASPDTGREAAVP
jgi:hypothetical protein